MKDSKWKEFYDWNKLMFSHKFYDDMARILDKSFAKREKMIKARK